MAKALKTLDNINLKVCYIAMVTVFFLMCMTTAHAVIRKTPFSGGITDSLGITELSMTLIVFCGFAFMESERGHVRVDMLIEKFPKALKKAVHSATLFITAAVLFVMCYAVSTNIVPTYAKHASTQILHIPFWPFMTVIAVGLFFYALTALFHAIERVAQKDAEGTGAEAKEVDVTTQM